MRSVFLWRILVMFIIVMLVAALLIAGGYVYFSRDTYSNIKLAGLTPEAEAIGQLYIEHAQAQLDGATFKRLCDILMRAADAMGIVADANGTHIYDSFRYDELSEGDGGAHSIRAQIAGAIKGDFYENNNIRLRDASYALSVCVPIENSAGEIAGAVYLLQSPEEMHEAINRLSNTFVLVIFAVVPFMLLLSSLGVKRMTEPLIRMGEVALEMSKGKFDMRANEDESGEVGLLARALNNLCDTLGQTIHQLRAEKSQLRQILASLSDGVAATDCAGCLTIYNPALMHMFGAVRVLTREELIPDNDIWAAFDGVFSSGKPATLRHTYGDRMIWLTLTPILSDEGERTGVAGLFRDMTEMENQERSRRDYIQNISHELRTPLTAMRGLLEPLSDGLVQAEDDRQRYYRIMLREVLRLSRLVTDMMQLSRLQSGMEYMELSEVDINEALEDVYFSYNTEAAQRGIQLKLEAPKLPHVLTDPDRVEQILVILLSNAMRYTPRGGVITIRAEEHARVNVSVSDTGCGISEQDLPKVFDRFFTVDKARNEGNTGLGLSIAAQLIEKLGEKIAVKSTVGSGSSFIFTLKKYVSNAIALGPAQDEWLGVEGDYIELFPANADIPTPEDAPYEVLPAKKEKAAKPEKKPSEKKRVKK